MPWFIYKYPEDPFEPSSYYLVKGKPRCEGSTLSAIYAETQPNTIPALPVLNDAIKQAINMALQGEITPSITLLRA